MKLALFLVLAAGAIRPSADMRDVSMWAGPALSPISVDALPYARTVTCTGSIVITGTSTVDSPVAWAAEPSGEAGVCTGTTSWSCTVTVAPDAVGEGVETVGIAQSGGGSGTVTVGFYVNGAHSCFLAQSVDGSYNSTLTDGAAVATWENLGSSALDLAQGTAGLRPTFRASHISGQPAISCDGGDRIAAATAADWKFLSDGTDATVDAVWQQTVAAGGVTAGWGTLIIAVGARVGVSQTMNDASLNEALRTYRGTGSLSFHDSVADAFPDGVLVQTHMINNDLGPFSSGANYNHFALTNSRFAGYAPVASWSASNPDSALTICAANNTGSAMFPLTGFVWRLIAYASPLSALQRGINLEVDRWALSTPMTSRSLVAADRWLFVGDSLTSGSGGVTTWTAKLAADAPTKTFDNDAASGATAAAIAVQFRSAPLAEKVFILGGINDIAVGTTAATAWDSLGRISWEAQLYGSTVVAMPTLPFGDAASWTAPRQVELEALEALIIASPNYNTLVNFYDLMGEPGSPEDLATVYSIGDGVHPNETGTTFMADEVAAALGFP